MIIDELDDKTVITLNKVEAKVMATMLDLADADMADCMNPADHGLTEAEYDIAVDFADPFRRFL